MNHSTVLLLLRITLMIMFINIGLADADRATLAYNLTSAYINKVTPLAWYSVIVFLICAQIEMAVLLGIYKNKSVIYCYRLAVSAILPFFIFAKWFFLGVPLLAIDWQTAECGVLLLCAITKLEREL